MSSSSSSDSDPDDGRAVSVGVLRQWRDRRLTMGEVDAWLADDQARRGGESRGLVDGGGHPPPGDEEVALLCDKFYCRVAPRPVPYHPPWYASAYSKDLSARTRALEERWWHLLGPESRERKRGLSRALVTVHALRMHRDQCQLHRLPWELLEIVTGYVEHGHPPWLRDALTTPSTTPAAAYWRTRVLASDGGTALVGSWRQHGVLFEPEEDGDARVPRSVVLLLAMRELHTLDLTSARIRPRIASALANLAALAVLVLDHTPLDRIPDALAPTLRVLSLRGLSFLVDDFTFKPLLGCPELAHLDVRFSYVAYGPDVPTRNPYCRPVMDGRPVASLSLEALLPLRTVAIDLPPLPMGAVVGDKRRSVELSEWLVPILAAVRREGRGPHMVHDARTMRPMWRQGPHMALSRCTIRIVPPPDHDLTFVEERLSPH